MPGETSKSVAIIVAHPDDETLWAGGIILSHPSWSFFIITLCRASDLDRAPKFLKALEIFKAEGKMGDLDDGPEQKLLDENVIEETIIQLLPQKYFDLIISHSPGGEYTRHIRHEEVGKAVVNLWGKDKISTKELWLFAYEDGGKAYYPRPIETANIFRLLTRRIWHRKYSIITEIYGFEKNSFEAETTPRAEAFWCFTDSSEVVKWFKKTETRI